MVSELLKMCLSLNRLLARALSVQVLGNSPQERDDVLLEAKLEITDIIKVFCNDRYMLPIIEIQKELCQILLMNTDLETMEVLLRVNTLVSYGMERLPSVEDMPMEIFEFVTTVVTQEQIRNKILSFLCILSKAIADFGSNIYLEQVFKLDQAISKTLAEKEEDSKLDSLCELSFILTEFMVTDYPDDSTEWIVQLNHLASQTLVEKFEDPKHLFRANNILSQAMRKLAGKPFFGELIELNCILSSVLMMDGTETRYNPLIGWKLLLTVIMQEVLFDDTVKHFTKSARETEKEEMELARLRTKLALVTQERDEIRAKARDMRKEIAELVKERDHFKNEIDEVFEEYVTLCTENTATEGEEKGDEIVPEKDKVLFVLVESIHEEGVKKSEEGKNLNGSEEKSEEKTVQQVLKEGMKDEGDKVCEKSESTAEGELAAAAIAGLLDVDKNVTEEVAGPSKVNGMDQSVKKIPKKKGAGGNNTSGVKKDDKKSHGPGSSRGQRSKKK